MRYELYIPIRVESEANLREHWSKKHKRHKGYDLAINTVWNQFFNGNPPTLPLTVTLQRIAPRPLDQDNLAASLKKIIDVIADLLIPNLAAGRADGDTRITWHYTQKKGAPKEYALHIEIEETSNFGEKRTNLSPY